MSDEIDAASNIEEYDRAMHIAAARVRSATIATQATGFCLYCDEPLPEGVRFCDADCRDDLAEKLNAAIRNGRGE